MIFRDTAKWVRHTNLKNIIFPYHKPESSMFSMLIWYHTFFFLASFFCKNVNFNELILHDLWPLNDFYGEILVLVIRKSLKYWEWCLGDHGNQIKWWYGLEIIKRCWCLQTNFGDCHFLCFRLECFELWMTVQWYTLLGSEIDEWANQLGWSI
jgi:hypothetical protein